MIKQSINSEIDLDIKAVSYLGLPSYGVALIGNKGFEYYCSNNNRDYIQIPWEEVEHVEGSVILGRYINRFEIFTKKNGSFQFSTKDNKKTLRAVNKYISSDKMLKSRTLFGEIKKIIKNKFKKK